jgi:hypothetical protein
VHSPPNRYAPRPRYEYKAPSLLAEYKYLAIIFLLILIGVSVYLIRAPRKPLRIDPPPPPPVYIEPIPQRPAGN